MSLFVPTWSTKNAGVNGPTSEPDKPDKALTGLIGEEGGGIYPHILPAAPRLPGRAARPCLGCGVECPEGVLFCAGTCFETWRARRAAGRAARGGAA